MTPALRFPRYHPLSKAQVAPCMWSVNWLVYFLRNLISQVGFDGRFERFFPQPGFETLAGPIQDTVCSSLGNVGPRRGLTQEAAENKPMLPSILFSTQEK